MTAHDHRPPALLQDRGRGIYAALAAYVISVGATMIGVLA
jgi:hypothetical protein